MEIQIVQYEIIEGIWYRQNKDYFFPSFSAHYSVFDAMGEMPFFSFCHHILWDGQGSR